MDGSHGRFLWYELMTTDIGAAKAFYAVVLRWGMQDASMPGSAYTLFTVGEAPVGGMVDLPEDVSGLTLMEPRLSLFVVANRRHPILRRRFSWVHEYGHVLLDRDQQVRHRLIESPKKEVS